MFVLSTQRCTVIYLGDTPTKDLLCLRWIRLWYGTTMWPLHRAIDWMLFKNVLYAPFCTQWHYLPYNTALVYCNIESLKLRRHNFQQKFFKHILLSSWELSAWYCSFINYSLKYYEWQLSMFVIVMLFIYFMSICIMLYILVSLLSSNLHFYCIIVFVFISRS